MTCTFLPDKTGKKYFFDTSGAASTGAVYSNPVQSSNFKNCHLITALSSVAWINNNYFKPSQDTYEVCKYTFWDPDPVKEMYPENYIQNIPVQVDISVNKNIFMDDVTNIWCGASSKIPEIWPAMYEKAFAKFCMFKIAKKMPFKDLNNAAIEPDFSILPNGSDWGGNPVTVLKYITGNPNKAKSYLTIDFKNLDGSIDPAKIYELIKSLCFYGVNIGKNSVYGLINGAKLQYPMGAFTYFDEKDALNKANVNIVYDRTTMVGDHCYSVLGIYENNGSQYILLRNPYGMTDPDPSVYVLGKGPWIYTEIQNQYIGTKKLTVFPAKPFAAILDLSIADGIFALDAKAFSQYFEGFGYIST
jgi:hypothetical protein